MAHTLQKNRSYLQNAKLYVILIQKMLGVGFEPTHPKILELESSALDRSAIQAIEAKPK